MENNEKQAQVSYEHIALSRKFIMDACYAEGPGFPVSKVAYIWLLCLVLSLGF